MTYIHGTWQSCHQVQLPVYVYGIDIWMNYCNWIINIPQKTYAKTHKALDACLSWPQLLLRFFVLILPKHSTKAGSIIWLGQLAHGVHFFHWGLLNIGNLIIYRRPSYQWSSYSYNHGNCNIWTKKNISDSLDASYWITFSELILFILHIESILVDTPRFMHLLTGGHRWLHPNANLSTVEDTDISPIFHFWSMQMFPNWKTAHDGMSAPKTMLR